MQIIYSTCMTKHCSTLKNWKNWLDLLLSYSMMEEWSLYRRLTVAIKIVQLFSIEIKLLRKQIYSIATSSLKMKYSADL